MNRKIFGLLLIGAIAVVITFAVFLLFFSKKDGKQRQPEQIDTPTTTSVSPTQTITQILSILKIMPEQDLTKEHFPITQVSVVFNMPVNPEGFFYTVDPLVKTNMRIGLDPNTIIISADHWWNEGDDGITTITIHQNTISTGGVYLEKPAVYKIKTAFPKEGV